MFELGDYVVVSNPDRTTDYDKQDAFVVTGFANNMFGEPLVKVKRLDRDSGTVFYPRELSLEG